MSRKHHFDPESGPAFHLPHHGGGGRQPSGHRIRLRQRFVATVAEGGEQTLQGAREIFAQQIRAPALQGFHGLEQVLRGFALMVRAENGPGNPVTQAVRAEHHPLVSQAGKTLRFPRPAAAHQDPGFRQGEQIGECGEFRIVQPAGPDLEPSGQPARHRLGRRVKRRPSLARENAGQFVARLGIRGPEGDLIGGRLDFRDRAKRLHGLLPDVGDQSHGARISGGPRHGARGPGFQGPADGGKTFSLGFRSGDQRRNRAGPRRQGALDEGGHFRHTGEHDGRDPAGDPHAVRENAAATLQAPCAEPAFDLHFQATEAIPAPGLHGCGKLTGGGCRACGRFPEACGGAGSIRRPNRPPSDRPRPGVREKAPGIPPSRRCFPASPTRRCVPSSPRPPWGPWFSEASRGLQTSGKARPRLFPPAPRAGACRFGRSAPRRAFAAVRPVARAANPRHPPKTVVPIPKTRAQACREHHPRTCRLEIKFLHDAVTALKQAVASADSFSVLP